LGVTLVAVGIGEHLLALAGEVELVAGAQAFAHALALLLGVGPGDEELGELAHLVGPLVAIDAEPHGDTLLGETLGGLLVGHTPLGDPPRRDDLTELALALALLVFLLVVAHVLQALLLHARAIHALGEHHVLETRRRAGDAGSGARDGDGPAD